MRILHICNSYCSTKVHSELYSELDKIGVEQIIYSYPSLQSQVGNNRFDGKHVVFVYSDVYRKYHRIIFHKKIFDIVKDICRRIDMSTIDCIHATTLFSDGGVAYTLHKKFDIPYVVAIRNTDVNSFMNYAPQTWLMGRKVLAHANKLIFISPSMYKLFCRKWFFKDIAKKSASKTIICPNGINTYWLEHIQHLPKENNAEILYIGRFDSNKNVLRLIQAFLQLRNELPQIHLTLVGGKGEQEKAIIALAQANKEAISYMGPIYERADLQHIMYKSSIFAMTSIYETFGLVYVEALSQGLPILFTKGQGVDGFFADDIGVAVNPRDTNAIIQGLRTLITKYDRYQGYRNVNFEQFRWSNIAKKYKEIIFKL